jgi:hypothetical protein
MDMWWEERCCEEKRRSDVWLQRKGTHCVICGCSHITHLRWWGLRWWTGRWMVWLEQSNLRGLHWLCDFFAVALPVWLSVVSWCRAGSMQQWAECQGEGGEGSQLLAFGCLGSRSWSCAGWSGGARGEWVRIDNQLSGEVPVLVWLKTSESVGSSWLSGEAQSVPVRLQMSESVCAACCPEMHHGLPLLLLVIG